MPQTRRINKADEKFIIFSMSSNNLSHSSRLFFLLYFTLTLARFTQAGLFIIRKVKK